MTKLEMSKNELSNTVGGINQSDGLKLANILANYHSQGRLGITETEFVNIYNTFCSGDDEKISEILNSYNKSKKDLAWLEMSSMYKNLCNKK